LKPYYRQILDELRSQIEQGTIAPGARLPSFTEMRVQRGASQATMERVYNELEQDGLIVRERGRGTFVSYQAERSRTGFIGFLGREFSYRGQFRHSAELVEGIEEVLHREGWRIALLNEASPVGWDKVDGVLISGGDIQQLNRSLPAGLPRVSVWRLAEGMLSVVADDYGGARMAVQHLLELGHRRIATIMQTSETLLRLRFAGYQDALRDAGIEAEPAWLLDPQMQMPQGGYREWGKLAMQQWMREGWKESGCTAIFVQNDVAAMGVIEALQEADSSVPDDVSIISFDGTVVCDYFNPRITAIQVPLHQIGVDATEALVRQIKGIARKEATLMLPTRFKPGGSTAPPAK
jgi:LacI family transcriptional regulator